MNEVSSPMPPACPKVLGRGKAWQGASVHGLSPAMCGSPLSDLQGAQTPRGQALQRSDLRSDGHILKTSTAVLKLSTAVLIANRQLRAPLAALNDRVRRRAMYRWKALFTHYILSQRTKPPYAYHQPVGQ